MGDWVYYSCLMTLGDLGSRVQYAHSLHRSRALSQYIQRALEAGRANDIAKYLATQEQRFFGSLVVAVYEGDPKWYSTEVVRSRTGSFNIDEVPEDTANSLGFLVIGTKEKLFALDGQHRLAGVKKGLDNGDIDPSEHVSVLMVAHRKGRSGLERTRRLFVTLNKTAVAVPKREIIALDEDDVAAICTRRLVDRHQLCNRKRIALNKTSNLSDDDHQHFTSIVALYDALMALFLKVPVPSKRKELRFNRPDADTVDNYYDTAVQLIEGLASRIQPFADYSKHETPSTVEARGRGDFGGHFLFRPIGLVMLCSLAAEVTVRSDLEQALDEIAKLPLDLSKRPLKGVLWNPMKRTMMTDGKGLAKRIFRYQLGADIDTVKLIRDIAATLECTQADVKLPKKISTVLSR